MIVKKTLQVEAYEYVKNKISSGEMKYNTMYSETQIAKELGISRTPMRDAIQCLAQEKYIDIIPNRGFILHEMSMDDFLETQQVRIAIEGYCARQLALDYEKEDAKIVIKKLEEILERIENIIDKSVEEYLEVDREFHSVIINYSNNNEIIRQFELYTYRMKNLASKSLQHSGRMRSAYEEHLDIYNNIIKGDAINTYESVVIHMEKPKNISLY